MNLGEHTDEALLSDVRRLIGSQRELTARLIVYLTEIEHRRLHLLASFSSMFEFCVKELRLSEGASAELRQKLERYLDLSSHANRRRELGFVIERAVELLFTKLERERLGKAERPRPGATTRRKPNASRSAESPRAEMASEVPASRHVSNADRRSVFERDGSRCTYVSPDGQRCEATAFLELDHIVPRALGGGTEARNLRVRSAVA